VLLRGAAPDEHSCLIIDVDLPDISGVDLLDRLRVRGINNPAIMITGTAVGSSLLSVITRANARLLQKPFSPSELISAIRIALGYCWICCVVAVDLAV
jgi:two-component system, LuxR family, response regulator FixJ